MGHTGIPRVYGYCIPLVYIGYTCGKRVHMGYTPGYTGISIHGVYLGYTGIPVVYPRVYGYTWSITGVYLGYTGIQVYLGYIWGIHWVYLWYTDIHGVQ